MTSWWNKNIEKRMDDFKSWVGDINQPSRVYCRKYIIEKNYENIIDCGCGIATDFYGYKNDNCSIKYTGLDSCIYLVNFNRDKIEMIEAELEVSLPIADNSYDCVYSREVIEHLSYYNKTIEEFIRIGKKEVIIVWFIFPSEDEDEINYWQEEDLYHNKYNKNKLEQFISSNTKVDKLFWKEIDDFNYLTTPQTSKKHILHIILK